MLNLLLIEDNEVAIKIGKLLLESIQCKVSVAIDVVSAYELLKRDKFDLVVSDIGLPDGTGYEIVKTIKADNNHLNFSTPFVALTANADVTNLKKGEQAGFLHLFQKPMQLKFLQPLIDGIIISSKSKEDRPVDADLPAAENELFELMDYQIFDLSNAIETLGDKALLQEMLEQMILYIPNDEAALACAYAVKDWDRIQKIAHRAKGGAVYCGLVRMRYACHYLERYHNDGCPSPNILEKLYQQLMQVLAETRNNLNIWLSEHS